MSLEQLKEEVRLKMEIKLADLQAEILQLRIRLLRRPSSETHQILEDKLGSLYYILVQCDNDQYITLEATNLYLFKYY